MENSNAQQTETNGAEVDAPCPFFFLSTPLVASSSNRLTVYENIQVTRRVPAVGRVIIPSVRPFIQSWEMDERERKKNIESL